MKNKQNKTNKFDDGSAMSLLVVSLLLFIIVVLGSLALIPKINEKYGDIISFPGLGGYSGEAKMKKFSSYNELKEFLEEGAVNASGMRGGIGMYGGDMFALNGFAEKQAVSDGAWGTAEDSSGVPVPAGGGDYSTTNVQVAGVDEGDIVKTDGEYIYAISGNDVVIAKAYPADSSEITARIKLD